MNTEKYYTRLSLEELGHAVEHSGLLDLKGQPIDVIAFRLALEYANKHVWLDYSLPELKAIFQKRKLSSFRCRNKANAVKHLAASDAQQVFPLMSLPPEIRTRIYRFAFVHKNPIRLKEFYGPGNKTRRDTYYDPGHGPYAEPALTRTSRLVREESLPIFYSLRTFPLNFNSAGLPQIIDRYIICPRWLNMRFTKFQYIRSFQITHGSRTCIIDLKLQSSTYTITTETTTRAPRPGEDKFWRVTLMNLEAVLNKLCNRRGVGAIDKAHMRRYCKILCDQ